MDKFRLWAQGAMPQLGAFLFFLITVPGVFFGGLWAVAGIGGGVLAFVLTWSADGKPPVPGKECAALVFAFLVLCVATSFQSVVPALSVHMTLQMTSILLPLVVFSSPAVLARIGGDKSFAFWPLAMGITLCLIAVEIEMDYPLQRLIRGDDLKPPAYNRGISYALIMAWPMVAMLWFGGKKRFLPWFLLMLLPALCLTMSRAAQMATCLSFCVFGVALLGPRLVRWGLSAFVLISSFWAFGARYLYVHQVDFVHHLPDSWRARMEIWDFMSYRIAERPLLGWGIGTSPKLQPESPHAATYFFMTGPAAHPHNALTEFWVELGVVGLLIGLAFTLLTLWWAGKQPKQMVPFALAAWTSGFVLSLCAYNFWTDSFLSMIGLLCVTFVVVRGTLFPCEQKV